MENKKVKAALNDDSLKKISGGQMGIVYEFTGLCGDCGAELEYHGCDDTGRIESWYCSHCDKTYNTYV